MSSTGSRRRIVVILTLCVVRRSFRVDMLHRSCRMLRRSYDLHRIILQSGENVHDPSRVLEISRLTIPPYKHIFRHSYAFVLQSHVGSRIQINHHCNMMMTVCSNSIQSGVPEGRSVALQHEQLAGQPRIENHRDESLLPQNKPRQTLVPGAVSWSIRTSMDPLLS